ncbi:uncharacterized protein LOC121383399 isoform X2 [Gigantopelta aegis]|uniref:uncharacterized protein LOC121383399 isoform X2 n=1 Tax=Gigantopelta aegis TaxID=1735272 RepID=UPI001B88E062|nr:uncharacterized protein LOC121383399 isoform X2 [Gigantopelta aegis]
MSTERMETKKWPGMVDTAYPEPFNKVPPPVATKKPGQLARDQIELFFKQGYVIVNEFFTAEELDPCRDAVSLMVDQLAQKLFNAGKIKDMYKDYGLFQRLTMLEKEYPGSNILLFKHQKMPKAFRDLWCNELMLNLVEQLIGPDIGGQPSWNLRTKTPFSDAGVIPWHQDSAYMSNESYDHLIPTAWIPLLDATEQNGCMQMVKNGHKSGIVARHTCCHANTWFVTLEEEEMAKTLGVDLKNDISIEPVPYGGFILFHNLTPHRSGANTSNDTRWSIDLRWQSPSHNWSFYDIQDGVVFRSSTDPDVKPDWDKFLSVDRKEAWENKYSKKEVTSGSEPEFSTVITGPWIGKWEIVNHNKHTEAFKQFLK